jgi:lysozyme family protein
MKQNYDFCVSEVLKSEGGYTNDPSDSGGATNFGITIADYRKYINPNGTPTDVKNMKVEDAKKIYKARYWDALDCDSLRSGVDFTVFDYGVNSGLQRPRNALKKFSSKTGADLINAINDERQAFLNNLAVSRPKDQKFLRGWTSRVSRVRQQSLDLFKTPQKDNVAGPAAGVVASGGFLVAFWEHVQAHPYLTAGIAVSVAFAVWFIVHSIRNQQPNAVV